MAARAPPRSAPVTTTPPVDATDATPAAVALVASRPCRSRDSAAALTVSPTYGGVHT